VTVCVFKTGSTGRVIETVCDDGLLIAACCPSEQIKNIVITCCIIQNAPFKSDNLCKENDILRYDESCMAQKKLKITDVENSG